MKFFWYHVWLWRGRYFIFTTSDFVQNEKEEREKKKKMGTGIIRKREEKGAFNNLVQEMTLADRESFFR